MMWTIIYTCLWMAYLSIGLGFVMGAHASIKKAEPNRRFSVMSSIGFLTVMLFWPFIVLAGIAKAFAQLGD